MNISTTEENQTEYLLNYKQFQRFYELLKPRSNLNFINKIQEKQLMYSTKYFPISHSELENIKSHLRDRLNEKLISEKNEGEKGLEKSSMEKGGETEQLQSEGTEQSQNRGVEQLQSEEADQQWQQQQQQRQQQQSEGINQQYRKEEEEEAERNQPKIDTFIWRPTKWQSFKIPNRGK